MFRALPAAAMTAVLALAAAAPALAGSSQPMMPLTPGFYWDYVSPGGVHQFEAIGGTLTLLGRTVTEKGYTGGPDAGLVNWWLTGPAGEVQLAGFDNPTAGLSLAYDPPITVCGGTPLAGDLWLTHVTAYQLPTMAVYATFDLTYGLIEEVDLTLPAGTFHTFGVGQVVFAAPFAAAGGAALGLDGRSLGTGPAATRAAASASDWYSPGVGDVQFVASDLFRLESYGVADPVHAATWGQVKQRWR